MDQIYKALIDQLLKRDKEVRGISISVRHFPFLTLYPLERSFSFSILTPTNME